MTMSMRATKKVLKRGLKVLGLALVLVLGTGASYAGLQAHEFDASLDRVYDIPIPTITLSKDPDVLARGEHLTHTIMPCAAAECHGSDFAGAAKAIDMGPVGRFSAPNITPANLGAAYSDGELFRLLRHGVKKDGRGIRFMPVQDASWLPDADLVAIISYLRTVAPVDRPNGTVEVGLLGKVLDRRNMFMLDIARHMDHEHGELAQAPAATKEYGRFLSRTCAGCHGEHLSGGPIPGAPPSVPTPLNLTPDRSGLADWTYDDFGKLLDTGVRKNGKKLDPFMPLSAFSRYDETERHALWAYLRTVPATPAGQR
jgi:mono/diheme cytochrome c family protein